jgi:SNF2 family DNA or RNA helicase
MPGYLFEYETFKSEIENQVVKYKDEYATTRLKRMVSPFILRRLKGDVLKDLPAKLEEIRYAKLDGEQQKLYDGQVVHMKNMIEAQDESEFQKNKMRILAELTKIRQICCNPSLFFDDYKGESAKTQACLDLIESANEGGHKMLVFSQFTSMLSILERELDERKIAYYKITGETKKDKRIELVNQFNQDDTPVFLISLRAGGTGLNLTGADIVIHYDPWWNVAVQNQATDRAHRIGQTKTVSVYKLIVKNSIEEKIVKMQDDKKNLADEILSGDMGSIGKLSKEDLLELIG